MSWCIKRALHISVIDKLALFNLKLILIFVILGASIYFALFLVIIIYYFENYMSCKGESGLSNYSQYKNNSDVIVFHWLCKCSNRNIMIWENWYQMLSQLFFMLLRNMRIQCLLNYFMFHAIGLFRYPISGRKWFILKFVLILRKKKNAFLLFLGLGQSFW